MENSLEFAKKFLPVLDDIYKYSSITQGMDCLLYTSDAADD